MKYLKMHTIILYNDINTVFFTYITLINTSLPSFIETSPLVQQKDLVYIGPAEGSSLY